MLRGNRRGAGWWAGAMAGPTAFIGRDGELSRLRGALGGDARLVLVIGAWVGKTRFAPEGMERAAAAGMVMVRGECLRRAVSRPPKTVPRRSKGPPPLRQDGQAMRRLAP